MKQYVLLGLKNHWFEEKQFFFNRHFLFDDLHICQKLKAIWWIKRKKGSKMIDHWQRYLWTLCFLKTDICRIAFFAEIKYYYWLCSIIKWNYIYGTLKRCDNLAFECHSNCNCFISFPIRAVKLGCL